MATQKPEYFKRHPGDWEKVLKNSLTTKTFFDKIMLNTQTRENDTMENQMTHKLFDTEETDAIILFDYALGQNVVIVPAKEEINCGGFTEYLARKFCEGNGYTYRTGTDEDRKYWLEG